MQMDGECALVCGKKALNCPSVFPALFKVHKTRSDPGRQSTREFLVYLDRKVENNLGIIFSFCSLACTTTISLSAIGLFHYSPVTVSRECHEEDQHGRTLFCYSNSNLPIDCLQ